MASKYPFSIKCIMSLCDTPKHEMFSRPVYDRLSLRGTKAVNPWTSESAIKSGLDIAPHPKLSPRFGGSTQGRLFFLSMSSGAGRKELVMETITLRCAFLDVHKESIKACVRRMEPDHRLHQETHHWER